MRSLIFTDMHLHTFAKFGRDNVYNLSKRLLEQRSVLEQILRLAREYSVDRVLFGGDWSHRDTEVPVEVLTTTRWFFEHLDIPFYAVRGNHDLSIKTSSSPNHYSLGAFLKELPPPKDVYFLHYDEPINYDKIRGYKVVLCHKMPIGSRSQAGYQFEEGVDWRKLQESNSLILFGHNHARQQLSLNCFVLGSPMQLNFGESHEAGVYILENDRLDFIALDSPKFITVESDAEVKDDNNYYRVLGDSKISRDNVISVKEPEYFDSRIKSNTLIDILKEWLIIKEKDESYLEVIKDDLNNDLFNFKRPFEWKLTQIALKNFMSFKEAEFEIENGLILVEGKNQGFSSNGSGKSSLLEALFWNLFGETTKGITGDDVIRKYPEQQKDCKVAIRLETESHDYVTIIRSRKDGLKIIQTEGGNSKVINDGMKLKESQEMLENQILGFGKEIFLPSVYFSQEQTLLLTKIGTAEKNSIVTTLLGFEQYEVLGNKLLARSNILDTEVNILDRQIAQIKGKLEILKQNEQNYISRESDLINRTSPKKKELEKVNEQITILTEKSQSLKVREVDLSQFDIKDKELNKELESLYLPRAKTLSLVVTEQDKEKQLTDRVHQLRSQALLFKNDILQKKAEIEKLSSRDIGSLCSYCGAILTEEHRDKYISDLQEKIQEDTLKATPTVNELQKEQESLKLISSNLETYRQQKDELDNRIDNLRDQIDLNQRHKEAKLHEKNELDKTESELKNQNNLFKRINDELSQLKKDYLINKENIKKSQENIIIENTSIETSNKRLEVIKQDKEKLDFWREAFSYKGIRSLLLDSWCNEINTFLKDYISEVSNGVLFAQFSPTSQTKAGESRNKLDLMIEIAGVQRQYESLSGGEKKRVDIACCLAFSKWIQQRYNLSSSLLNIQIFDELFDALDASGFECMAPILQRESVDKALFIISHSGEMNSYVDRVITVQKESMISRILT